MPEPFVGVVVAAGDACPRLVRVTTSVTLVVVVVVVVATVVPACAMCFTWCQQCDSSEECENAVFIV